MEWARDVSHLTFEDAARMPMIVVHRIYAEVTSEEAAPLLQYMQSQGAYNNTTSGSEPLATLYVQHAREVFAAVAHGWNRLLTFVRAEKGQHWLNPFPTDFEDVRGLAHTTNAQARVGDEAEWFVWDPRQQPQLITVGLGPIDRYLRQEDWDRARAFVVGQGKVNLARQLLVQAEALAVSGNNRAALTEAVSALEVAFHRFIDARNADNFVSDDLRERLGVSWASRLVEKVGFTKSVELVLPVLLPESILPRELIQACVAAIKERHSVIHNGQRTLRMDRLEPFLTGLRRLIETLLTHTEG
jgi:hypothetical protein